MSLIEGIPPVISLLLNEEFAPESRTKDIKKLKGLFSDLRNQAEIKFYDADGSAVPKMRAFLSGGLDLFGNQGACWQFDCRLGYADQVARSIALMSDEVWMYDYFTERVLAIAAMGRLTNARLNVLLDDIYVLHRIRPLIGRGILRFQTPFRAVCSSCKEEFERRLDMLTYELYKEFRNKFRLVKNRDETLSIDTGPTYDPPLFLMSNIQFKERPKKADLVKDVIYSSVRSSLWAAVDAGRVHGALFSNSPVGLSGLLREEGRFPGGELLQAFEMKRAGSLPWVSGLSVQQTLQLREEASKALPKLREFLGRHLAVKRDGTSATTEQDYVYELREQAAEVRSELEFWKSRRPSVVGNAIGLMSLSIFAYGFATETIPLAAGLGQLLTTLGFLHTLGNSSGQHKSQLESRPGYVLVKAQDILQHAKVR